MFSIVDARRLASDIVRFRVLAPRIAAKRQPGQFVILRLDETGERIPLTIVHSDAAAGTIDLIVKAIGKTTMALCRKRAGESISNIVGPLGRPTELIPGSHAVLIGGGVGTAVIYPLVEPLRASGNFVTVIVGGRTREQVLLETELSSIADAVFACTDDGSYGFHGNVADRLSMLLGAVALTVDSVYAAGPVPMMRAVANVTRPKAIQTIVSLNPIMVDGTGMCGGCRVTVKGEQRFACVDGPDFDALDVDFDELADRLKTYRNDEQKAMEFANQKCGLNELSSLTEVGER